jgi:CrcB protein
MYPVLFVGLGGFVGACARFGITSWFSSYSTPIPLGTLLSNVIAGFLVGLIVGLDREYSLLSENMRLFLIPGIFGGLSTFSTFSIETLNLITESHYLKATTNTLLNVGLSLTFVALGLLAAKTANQFI